MKHLTRAVAVAAALVLAAAACNANDKSATSGGSTAAAEQGGTWHVLTTSKEINLDPAKSQNLAITTLDLVLRGLTTLGVPSRASRRSWFPTWPPTPVTVSDGGKTWTYTLKPGLEVRRRRRRSLPPTSSTASSAPSRPSCPAASATTSRCWSAGTSTTARTRAASWPRSRRPTTRTHRLQAEQAVRRLAVDRLSMPAFAPVPKRPTPTRRTTARTPVACGPYQVKSYQPGSKLELERNPDWDTSRPTRSAPACRTPIVFQLGLDADRGHQRLIADAGDDKFAFAAGIRRRPR